MNGKGMTAVSTVLMAFPWTLLILRRFTWALQSPVGEILIGLYAGIMILGGIFTIWAYAKRPDEGVYSCERTIYGMRRGGLCDDECVGPLVYTAALFFRFAYTKLGEKLGKYKNCV